MLLIFKYEFILMISGSIKVSMGACHALDPGSIPGWRVFLFLDNF